MNRREFNRLAAVAACGLMGAARRAAATGRGPVTNLPLPRFVSLKTSEGNARHGPGLSNRIDWVFVRAGMPLRITAEFEHWRRVEDSEGFGGWMHYSLLSGVRTVLFTAPLTRLHRRDDDASLVVAKAESGVIARLEASRPAWCRVNADGAWGWVPKTTVWGVGPDEILN